MIRPQTCKRLAGKGAITFVNRVRAGKKSSKIFVHCSAGISRSPAVVAFYLMQGCGMSLKQALGLIIRAWPNAWPNPGFISQLLRAELECRGSSSLPPDLTSLPSKKEERLALFYEGKLDGDVHISQPAPTLHRVGVLLLLLRLDEEILPDLSSKAVGYQKGPRKNPSTPLTARDNVTK